MLRILFLVCFFCKNSIADSTFQLASVIITQNALWDAPDRYASWVQDAINDMQPLVNIRFDI